MKSRHVNDLRVARLRLRRPGHEKLPKLIQNAVDACAQIVTKPELFPELGSGRGQKRFLFGQPNRERHLVRLEACAKVLACLVGHMDLVTQRAGKRRRDGSCDAIRTCRPYGKRAVGLQKRDAQTTIEKETGLGRSAVERAVRDLNAATYTTSHQPRKKYCTCNRLGCQGCANGEKRWRTFPMVRTVTKTALKRLGVDLGELDKQARLARLRQEEGPKPTVDVRLLRERQRMVRGQAMAAKHAQLVSTRAERMVSSSAERIERLYQKRRE